MNTKCPFCGNTLKKKLAYDFYECHECYICIRKGYPKDNREENSKIYDLNWCIENEKNQLNIDRAKKILNKIKKINDIHDILDIGCGSGLLVEMLEKNGYNSFGLDINPLCINYAKKHRKGKFYHSSIDQFNLKNKFDLIILSEVIEHIYNPFEFLIQVKKFLKNKAYLIIETPNYLSWNPKSLWRRHIGGLYYGIDHIICYSPVSLKLLMDKLKFRMVQMETITYSNIILIETFNTLLEFFNRKIYLKMRNFNGEKRILKNKNSQIKSTNIKTLIRSFLNKIYNIIFIILKNSYILSTLIKPANFISNKNFKGVCILSIWKTP